MHCEASANSGEVNGASAVNPGGPLDDQFVVQPPSSKLSNANGAASGATHGATPESNADDPSSPEGGGGGCGAPVEASGTPPLWSFELKLVHAATTATSTAHTTEARRSMNREYTATNADVGRDTPA
jgi:hypothetical protein